MVVKKVNAFKVFEPALFDHYTLSIDNFSKILFNAFRTGSDRVECIANVSDELSVADLARYYEFIIVGRRHMGENFRPFEEALMSQITYHRDVQEGDLATSLALALMMSTEPRTRTASMMSFKKLRSSLLSRFDEV